MLSETFSFEPTFNKLEELLSVYKKAETSAQALQLKVELSSIQYSQKMTAPFPQSQIWLSLDYAMELMRRSHASGQSKIEVVCVLR